MGNGERYLFPIPHSLLFVWSLLSQAGSRVAPRSDVLEKIAEPTAPFRRQNNRIVIRRSDREASRLASHRDARG
jgi:hypothetical protein